MGALHLSILCASMVINSGSAGGRAELPDEAPAHLSIALRVGNQAQLDALLSDLSDPRSPRFHAWLTPEEFGRRFGVPSERLARIIGWLHRSGFEVKAYPNRLFIEATGTAAQVHRLLGVRLQWVQPSDHSRRTFAGALAIPADIGRDLLHISGLDTRVRHRHRFAGRLKVAGEGNLLGAGDFRALYDLESLTSGGKAAAGLTTAILGTQEGTQANPNAAPTAPFVPPSSQAIAKYFSDISGATATYNPIVMSNPNDDFDAPPYNEEYQLDVQMQSVGAANADQIDLVMAPASEVFTTGAEYIVNSLPAAVVVSTSLGYCEFEEKEFAGGGPTTPGTEVAVLRQAVQQGVTEGQTWFAAAGDRGADDCNDGNSGSGNGFDGGNATVDFPGSMPEIVDLGGSQFAAAGAWNAQGDLTAWQDEVVWNEGEVKGAGGGGQSAFYSKPSWQLGVGPESSDGVRDVPDISLSASYSHPGVAVYACGSGQTGDSSCTGDTTGAGSLYDIGGTSVGSPLAAGIFALLAGQKGCHLGDIHSTLYALGTAQLDGGPQVFHDITAGNNSFVDPKHLKIDGFAASSGYDLASGWGTLDVAALLASWPACAAGPTRSSSSSSSSSGGLTSLSSVAGSLASATSAAALSSTGGSSSSSAAATAGSSSSGTSTAGTSTKGSSVVGTTGSPHSASSVTGSASSGSSSLSATNGSSSEAASSSAAGTTGTAGASHAGCSCSGAGDSPFLLALCWIGLLLRLGRSRSIELPALHGAAVAQIGSFMSATGEVPN